MGTAGSSGAGVRAMAAALDGEGSVLLMVGDDSGMVSVMKVSHG